MDKIVKFEIPVSDLEKAKKFYLDIFNWKIEPFPGSDSYFEVITSEKTGKMNMSMDKGVINGGLQKKGPRVVMPTFVIQTENIDKAIEGIKKMGGKIAVEKQDMGGKGFYAQFDDSEGNRMGMFQPVKK